VRTVPVYQLRVARGFDRLTEVVAQIRSWHAATETGVETTRAARGSS
jgi:hypothetical protein